MGILRPDQAVLLCCGIDAWSIMKLEALLMLEIELQYFQAHVGEWIEHHAGKFALVVGEGLAGVYDSPETAYGEGARRVGNKTFLVKRISGKEETYQNPALLLGLIHASF